MTSIHHPLAKNEKQFMFYVRLDWINGLKGVLTSNEAKDPIYVATPPAFGGEEGEWSPEHLFLSSISSCFMSTFLFFCRKMNLKVVHIECQATGQIELVDGGYHFTHINVFPTVHVSDQDLAELARLAMVKAQKHCIVSNAVKSPVEYHAKVILAE